MLKERLLKQYDLGENVGYEEDMLEELVDYSGYICDAIMDLSDRYVDIYDYNQWEIAPVLRDYIEDSIQEFGISKQVNLADIFRQGQYYYNSSLFYENLDDIIWNMAVIKLDEIIEAYNIDLPAYNVLVEEIEGYLNDCLADIDNNNYINDIENVVENMFKDYIKDKKYEEV